MAMRSSPNPKTPSPVNGLRPRPASIWPNGTLAAALLFGIGLTVGWVLHSGGKATEQRPTERDAAGADHGAALAQSITPTQVRAHHAGLSHPLLYCDEAVADNHLDALHTSISGVFARAVTAGTLSHGSVVYRTLDSGNGFEIDADRKYHPASLLKLPLAIAWMRRAESNPGILERKLPYALQTLREAADTPGALIGGESYTARELMERMIRWSRNDAKAVLAQEIGDDAVKAVYAELDFPWPFTSPDIDPELSARDYSRLFRVVYDASMLHPKAADELLQMLSTTEYDAALKAGLPAGTQVAHKWGHRNVKGAPRQAAEQLHDCGIIYKPGRPFLLCVMTAGVDEAALGKVIADVARNAWNAEL